MRTRLRFYNAVPMDLMPCKMNGRDVEAEIIILRSASSELSGSNAELEGV